MSWGSLRKKIINSALPREEKCILLDLWNYAQDDGSRVYPSVERIAWDTGYSERQVRKIIHKLQECGVLVIVKKRGRRTSREFRIDLSALPTREPFKSRPEESSGLDSAKAAKTGLPPSIKTGTFDNQDRNFCPQDRNFSALRPEESSGNPLSESLKESLKEKPPDARARESRDIVIVPSPARETIPDHTDPESLNEEKIKAEKSRRAQLKEQYRFLEAREHGERQKRGSTRVEPPPGKYERLGHG